MPLFLFFVFSRVEVSFWSHVICFVSFCRTFHSSHLFLFFPIYHPAFLCLVVVLSKICLFCIFKPLPFTFSGNQCSASSAMSSFQIRLSLCGHDFVFYHWWALTALSYFPHSPRDSPLLAWPSVLVLLMVTISFTLNVCWNVLCFVSKIFCSFGSLIVALAVFEVPLIFRSWVVSLQKMEVL